MGADDDEQRGEYGSGIFSEFKGVEHRVSLSSSVFGRNVAKLPQIWA
jgi:hypothetical protein